MGDVPAIPGPVRYPVIPAARVSNRRCCGTGAPEAPPPFPTHSMVLASHWPMFVPVVAAPPFCLRHASLCPAFRTHRLVRCDVTAAPSLRSLGGTAVRQTAEAVEAVAAILEQGVGPDAVEGARSPSLAAMAAPLGTGTFTEETGQEKQVGEPPGREGVCGRLPLARPHVPLSSSLRPLVFSVVRLANVGL